MLYIWISYINAGLENKISVCKAIIDVYLAAPYW